MGVISTDATARVVAESIPDQQSLGVLVALHLVPGALVTASFVLLAPVAERLGLPPIAALLAGIVFVLVPFELGVVVRAGRRLGSPLAAVPYRHPMPTRTWLWLAPTLVLAAFVGFGASQAIEPQVIKTLFGWLPDWFVTPISLDRIGEYSTGAWLVTLAAFLAINGFVGPIVEELYFRGYLLPRLERLGRWAPLVNVTLFSLYHFWSPWQLIARIVGLAPMVYAVRWKRNVYVGMAVHCTLNTIGVLLVAALVFGRL